jgi:hypothetical protein
LEEGQTTLVLFALHVEGAEEFFCRLKIELGFIPKLSRCVAFKKQIADSTTTNKN